MEREDIEEIVKKVVANLDNSSSTDKVIDKVANKVNSNASVSAEKDYPLGSERPELIETPTNKKLEDITLDKVLSGEIKDADLRITPETLNYQAEIARQKGREQFAKNLERAAELTQIPDERILEIYESLRPNRSTKEELLAIANELENEYDAVVNANLVRDAAEVYEKRNRLKED